jgi:hypothetical protein
VSRCLQALQIDDVWEDDEQLQEMAGLNQPLADFDLGGASQQVCMSAAAPPAVVTCCHMFHRLPLYVVARPGSSHLCSRWPAFVPQPCHHSNTDSPAAAAPLPPLSQKLVLR